MALYPTVPICIQLTDYELETPELGVAPVYSVMPPPPPPYNPSLYPSLYDLDPPHNLPQFVALVPVHPMLDKGPNVSAKTDQNQTLKPKPSTEETKITTRDVILNKKDGKFGIKTAAIHKNIFIYRVSKGSSAAHAGLKLGDQIIKINGVSVTGMTNDNVHDVIKRCPQYGIKFTIRIRNDLSVFKRLDNVKKIFNDW